jgi:hypothetical protein
MGNNLTPGQGQGKKGDQKKRNEAYRKREAPPQRVGRKKRKKGVDTASKLPSGFDNIFFYFFFNRNILYI